MALLWGMMNTLQLILHTQMLSVIMPANVQFFFSFLVDIVNFKIIPSSWIDSLMGFKQDFKGKASAQF